MIDSAQKLAEILPPIRDAEWLGLDTEADSLYCYPEKICLIQISIPGRHLLIDPLKKFDLSPLFESMKSKTLILHAADYDLRLLHRNYGFIPEKIFDTMFAARLLGYKQFGLADVVRKHTGVILDKTPQLANWSIRPLNAQMLKYAIMDIQFLKPLQEVLSKKLVETGRLRWHQEMCANLVEKIRINSRPHSEPWRVSGSNSLTPAALCVLRELWHWREQVAIRENKPPFFILSHNVLVKIAAAAADGSDFAALLPRGIPENRCEEINETVKRAMKTPPEKYPHQIEQKTARLTPKNLELLSRITKHRNRVADKLKIERSVIASQAELLQIARNPRNAKNILMSWQYELLKEAINGQD